MTKAEHKANGGAAVDLSVEYGYDVFGNLIQRSVDSDGVGATAPTIEKFAYEGANAWADLDNGGSLTTRRVFGDSIDELIARIDGNGVAWYLTDRLNSVRDIVDDTGALINHINYASYGERTQTQPANGDRYGYTGQEHDDVISKLQIGRRWYDFYVAQFMQQDPIGFAGGTNNLTEYVSNNPANATDPTGLNELVATPTGNGRTFSLEMADEFLGINYRSVWIGYHDPATGLVRRGEAYVPYENVVAAGDVGWAADWDAWFRANDLNLLWEPQRNDITRNAQRLPYRSDANLQNQWMALDPGYEDQLREIGRLVNNLPGFVATDMAVQAAGGPVVAIGEALIRNGYRVVRRGGQALLASRVNGQLVVHSAQETARILNNATRNRFRPPRPPAGAPRQVHHAIPWENGTYAHQNHSLVHEAGVSLQQLPAIQRTVINHMGRHTNAYHDEITARLTAAWTTVQSRGLSGPALRDAARSALNEVMTTVWQDIGNNTLWLYHTRPVWLP